MVEEQIVNTLRNIKRMCLLRYFGNPFDPMCEGCSFELKSESKRGNYCQLTMLIGNLAKIPADWDMDRIEEIIND